MSFFFINDADYSKQSHPEQNILHNSQTGSRVAFSDKLNTESDETMEYNIQKEKTSRFF